MSLSREKSSRKRPKHDKHEEKWNEQSDAAKQPRRERKEEIKHLLDRERPKYIPVGRQVSAMRLKNIDVKGERREQRATKPTLPSRNDEILKSRKVQRTENRKQRKQQRTDASQAEQIEITNADVLKCAPTFERDRRDQKSRDREKDLNSELPVPSQRVNERLRNPIGVRYVVDPKASIDVIHQHAKNRQPAQQINPIEPRPTVPCRITRLRHRKSILCAQTPAGSAKLPPISRIAIDRVRSGGTIRRGRGRSERLGRR
jgi:hypothetical protein